MNLYICIQIDTLVVIISVKHQEAKIIFLDLMTNEWFKGNAQCAVNQSSFWLIDGKDNYVYFMRYEESPCLFKISWIDIIRKEICKSYKMDL